MSLSSAVDALAAAVGAAIKTDRTNIALKAPLASPTFTGTTSSLRRVRTPYTLTYGATLTPNMTNGGLQRCALTGDATIAEPTNGTDGEECLLELTAAATRTVTLFSRRLSFITSTFQVPAGGAGFVLMVYRTGTGWTILAAGPTA
jgi:hypothetical protein